jgi:hypothetical protein
MPTRQSGYNSVPREWLSLCTNSAFCVQDCTLSTIYLKQLVLHETQSPVSEGYQTDDLVHLFMMVL